MPPHLSELYILDPAKNVIPAPSYRAWKRAWSDTDRTVALTALDRHRSVHTFFTGINVQPKGEAPLLFETVVTGITLPVRRYFATWSDALEGHALVLAVLGRIVRVATMPQPPLLVLLEGGKAPRKPARASDAALGWDEPLQSNGVLK